MRCDGVGILITWEAIRRGHCTVEKSESDFSFHTYDLFGLCFVFSYVVSLHIIFSLDLILILAKGSLL